MKVTVVVAVLFLVNAIYKVIYTDEFICFHYIHVYIIYSVTREESRGFAFTYRVKSINKWRRLAAWVYTVYICAERKIFVGKTGLPGETSGWETKGLAVCVKRRKKNKEERERFPLALGEILRRSTRGHNFLECLSLIFTVLYRLSLSLSLAFFFLRLYSH